jgi:hypothetical protein
VNDDASANDAKADLFLGEHRSVADADHNPLPRQLRCRLSQTLFMFIGREWNREKIIVVHFFNNKLINKQKKKRGDEVVFFHGGSCSTTDHQKRKQESKDQLRSVGTEAHAGRK